MGVKGRAGARAGRESCERIADAIFCDGDMYFYQSVKHVGRNGTMKRTMPLQQAQVE
jgi:hypothetical protein